MKKNNITSGLSVTDNSDRKPCLISVLISNVFVKFLAHFLYQIDAFSYYS